MRVNQPPEYIVWATMKTRCRNKRHHTYKSYGAKGITICSRWDDFAAFIADLGPRPDGYTLERIDSRGNYEPGNCRWATRRDQNNNRCINRIVEYRGERMALGRAIELSGTSLPYSTIRSRIVRRGWDLERALSEPKLAGEDLRKRQSSTHRAGEPASAPIGHQRAEDDAP